MPWQSSLALPHKGADHQQAAEVANMWHEVQGTLGIVVLSWLWSSVLLQGEWETFHPIFLPPKPILLISSAPPVLCQQRTSLPHYQNTSPKMPRTLTHTVCAIGKYNPREEWKSATLFVTPSLRQCLVYKVCLPI